MVILGTLSMQLLLQFYSDSFQTLQVFIGHGLKMCILFSYHPQIIFCHLFHKINLPFFRQSE